MKAALILEDGTVINGNGFGAEATRIGELVFNTSMIGYQEALTDPSYAGQILIMTYPMIGNYGISEKNSESSKIHVEGFVVREFCTMPDHRENIKTIDQFLRDFGVPGIYGIDTRFLVRKIRSHGVMPCILSTYNGELDLKKLSDSLEFKYSAVDFVRGVSTKKPEIYGEGKKTVVLIDLGVKMGIVREMVKRGFKVVVLPSNTTIEQIKSYEPLGIILSNGPGDPKILTGVHNLVRDLADYPLFGICLGHQVVAHAFGGDTFKLKFGHRGSNHPVSDKLLNRTIITTQNHGFAVSKVPDGFEVTHLNGNDNTVEGMMHREKPIFTVQFHPEASPGPKDANYFFDQFIKKLGV